MLLAVIYGVLGIAIGAVTVYVRQLQNRPDLLAWHLAELDEEFDASRSATVKDLDAYRQVEARLFAELGQKVYVKPGDPTWRTLSRYSRNALSDPDRGPINWNRTVELKVAKPRAKALLLHGLSDSPYSMRRLAQLLHEQKIWVVNLRMPGHGTAPSALLKTQWQDFAAATRLAVRHLHENVDTDLPFYMVGYSNGAALAVEYALAILEGENAPLPERLLLVSPAIGVTAAATLAIWQSRLAAIPGLEKLAWTAIQPEFDPYKYNSFAVNAGHQIHLLTQTSADRINRLDTGHGVRGFPPVLAFQSVVDATVPPSALIDRLFARLAPAGHELVLFDVNRHAEAEPLLKSDPEQLTAALLGAQQLHYDVTLLTNVDNMTNAIHALHKNPSSSVVWTETLDQAWPKGVYALSHVAVPFPPDDPLYGENSGEDQHALHLGRIELRGERGLLVVPTDQLTRLRYNPFYSYLERRVLEFISKRE